MEIVIPCAGEGLRFKEQGYTTIKQLLPLNGHTVLHYLIDALRCENARFTFIFQEKQLHEYGTQIEAILQSEHISYQLCSVPVLTDGAVSTVLQACAQINLDEELLVVNSDQWVRWNMSEFLYTVRRPGIRGAMPVFIDAEQNPKWSFVSMDGDNYITEVRAKDPFTSHAVVGIYYFKTGHDYMTYANRMIAANKRVNREFYVCPVFNEMLSDGHDVYGYFVQQMVGLGTPDDYERAKQFFAPIEPAPTSTLIHPITVPYVAKTWGHEIWFANHKASNYCGKILQINEGQKFSMHFHRDKHETFYVLSGRVIIRVVDYATGRTHEATLTTGQSCEIPRELPHQLEAVGGSATILEASTFHRDSDSYRLWR